MGAAAKAEAQGPPPRMPACRALSWCAPGAGHGECVAGLLRLELGERLGLQLPGGGPRLPARGPPGCPPSVSMPSEFSSISWMRGGIDPGISIFSVITRSAPAGRVGVRALLVPPPTSTPKPAPPKQHPQLCSSLGAKDKGRGHVPRSPGGCGAVGIPSLIPYRRWGRMRNLDPPPG